MNNRSLPENLLKAKERTDRQWHSFKMLTTATLALAVSAVITEFGQVFGAASRVVAALVIGACFVTAIFATFKLLAFHLESDQLLYHTKRHSRSFDANKNKLP